MHGNVPFDLSNTGQFSADFLDIKPRYILFPSVQFYGQKPPGIRPRSFDNRSYLNIYSYQIGIDKQLFLFRLSGARTV